MKIELNKEILEYVEQNTEAEGILTSCREILIPYILKNHEESLYEYIELSDIEFINIIRTTEIKVLNTDKSIKIKKATFKNIEKELIQPLFNSLKDLNLEYTLKIECDSYVANGTESNFSGCWKEFRITNYDYQARLICPSLDEY
ncbi:hypothetical protein [Helicobacter pullorum]|uniref:hypothetical protein n=1 Tax=Helicobacter pullorum TaxID=35818 RepID=UPI00241EE0BC|nr:hypothetical protein [Helicobacter pullorum]